MIIGFTGTREGMTRPQAAAVEALLAELGVTRLHHGDAVGADAEAHAIAGRLGAARVVHPPVIDAARAFCDPAPADEVRREKTYHQRNRDIVAACEVLVAAPKEARPLTYGGTWYSVREALKHGSGPCRAVHVCWPDGTVTRDFQRSMLPGGEDY